MVRIFLSQRFTRHFVDEKLFKKSYQLLGPFQNFVGINTTKLIHIRRSGEETFRIVNNHYANKNNSELNYFIQGFLQTFSDSIITNVMKTFY